MIRSALIRFNRLGFWRRRVLIGADRLRATSLDRLIYLLRWRWFESRGAEAGFLRSQLRPGMRVVDAGSNLGAYAHLFARCVGETGCVTAFEPDPVLFAALAGNVRDNGLSQIRLHRLALGASASSARLASGGLNSGDNRLSAPGSSEGPGAMVDVVTLDQIVAGERVDFIKIDVQGWELHALRGMRQTLAANPRVQLYLELWPHGLVRVGSSPDELLAFLTEQGFRYEIRPGNPPIAAFDLAALSRRTYWFTDVYARRP